MLFDFVKTLAKREASLQAVPGYLGVDLRQEGQQVGSQAPVCFV